MTVRPGGLVRALLTVTLVVVPGCGDEVPVEPPAPVATTVTVSPASATMQALDDTVRLSATVLDQDGRVMAAAVVEWSSGVAVSVDSSGLVTAVGNGEAVVTARSGGVVGEAVVMVEQVVAEIRVVPDSVAFTAIGDTTRLMAAAAVDANGYEVLGTGYEVLGTGFEWSSGDTAVVVVDSAGLVTALGNGTATVTAGSGGVVGEVVVAVEQVVAEVQVVPDWVAFAAIGDTARLVAEAVDANGYGVASAGLKWSSSDNAVAVVDGAGLVAAVGTGEATVTAESGQVEGSATAFLGGEREILEAFYHAAGGPHWVRDDNWLTDAPLGNWYGVGTDLEGRVTVISLKDNGLEGTLPPHLAGLMELRVLDLSPTRWVTSCERSTGSTEHRWAPYSFPTTITNTADRPDVRFLSRRDGDNWTETVEVMLDDASATSLTKGGASGSKPRVNRLTGTIPSALGQLSNLVRLSLAVNEFSGAIPPKLGQLTSLRDLHLSANQLSGPIPREFGNLIALETLGLSDNELTGPIPRELWSLAALVNLDIFNNRFGSPLPPGIASLTQLKSFRAICASLTGPIPSDLGDLRHLEHVDFFGNELSGPIPLELGNLRNLGWLGLSFNRLSGSVPPELGGLSSLSRLALTSNEMTGEIPLALSRLSSLKYFELGYNQFSGSIPQELGRLRDLIILRLDGNRLSGSIPSALGRLAQLKWLDLADNHLSGSIPPELGQLSNLGLLALQRNGLDGGIPPELGRLGNLTDLWLGGNRLSGSIPAVLGRSANLRHLLLDGNELTGPVPSELGQLVRLLWLSLEDNRRLSGSLPLDLANLDRLQRFDWLSTDLCVPRNHRFRNWIAAIPDARGPADRTCPALPASVLEAFHSATGGAGWRNSANWLTGSPLSSWHGITVEDSLVTALDLSDNNLTGTLPQEIGEFVDVKDMNLSENGLSDTIPATIGDLEHLGSLNLSNNGFAGPVPRSIGSLDSLRRLDLSGNEMSGALPSSFVQLGALEQLRWDGSGICAPEAVWFQTWLSSVATRDGPTCDAPYVLSIPGAHLTQATQTISGTVPIIAGRPALLRVFATADRANDHQPVARATLRGGGGQPFTGRMTLESVRGVPDAVAVDDLARSYGTVIPASVLRPGVEMVVELDPDNTVPRAVGSQMRLPEVGGLGLDVRELPEMALTIVPVVAESSADRGVLDWVEGPADPPVELLRSILPIADFDLTVREPLRIAQAPRALVFDDWLNLLQDIDLLRTTEGENGYWYGVVRREGDVGIGGIAYTPGRASLGIADSEVFAHEVGHNMSLNHAPCGGPSGIDPDFPYWDGSIGVPGYDFRSGELVDPSAPDVMSYCGGAWRGGPMQWISDYHFTKAMEYRLDVEAAQTATAATAAAARQPSRAPRLLVRGGISPDGDLHLDPAFVLDAPAKTPTAPGPYRIEAVANDGSFISAHDFDMDEISVGGGGFLFLLPFSEAAIGDLDRIVLTGPEASVALDRGAPVDPVAIVLDRATGHIRSILRGEEAAAEAVRAQVVGARAGAAVGGATLTLISYGLPGS